MGQTKQTLLQIRLSYVTDTEKMTQYRFAKHVLKVHPSQYCGWEKMQREPLDTTKMKIANNLGRTIESIIWKL